jgi:microcystin-dependent protein
MADVTITNLPDLTPSSNTYVPISNGTTTGKALTNTIGIPRGTIVMWSNYLGDSIPTGWQLCDGTNSTPDLRNRFVVGSGSSYATGNTGGTANAVVVSHTHTITDPGHTHSSNLYYYDGEPPGNYYRASIGARYTGTRDTNSATTGITVNSTGESGTNANLPPYYALAFIIKTT